MIANEKAAASKAMKVALIDLEYVIAKYFIRKNVNAI